MNFGYIAKVLLIGGGGITTVGALPNIVSSSSDKSSSKSRSKRNTSLNQEGFIVKNEKFGVKNYCFYFSTTGIVGVLGGPIGKSVGACENLMSGHLATHRKQGAPKIEYDWTEEDKKAGKNKKVLLISGTKNEKGLFDGSKEERTIVGCFDKGWWGGPQHQWQVIFGPKVGSGYMDKIVEWTEGSQRKSKKLTKGACSSGGYESSMGMESIVTRLKMGENNNDWEIKYFGDLTWTLKR